MVPAQREGDSRGTEEAARGIVAGGFGRSFRSLCYCFFRPFRAPSSGAASHSLRLRQAQGALWAAFSCRFAVNGAHQSCRIAYIKR